MKDEGKKGIKSGSRYSAKAAERMRPPVKDDKNLLTEDKS